MTEEYRVIKRFESFVLGVCKCGCRGEINIRNKQGILSKYAHGHNNKGKKRFIPKGENAPNYRGGEVRLGNYKGILSPNHPFKNKKGYVPKHRLELEKHYTEVFGIPIFILPYFDVHHKDGNIENNNWQNLQIVHRRDHTKIHNPFIDRTGFKCIVPDCKSPYETYITKKGNAHWYKYKDGWMCSRCYDRIIRIIDYKKVYRKDKEKYQKKALQYHYKNREKILQRMKDRYWKKKREKNNLSSLDNYT